MAARLLGSGATVEETFQLIVDAALRTIPSCTHAGVFVFEDGVIHTIASNDPLVAQIDQAQMQNGEGPCLDAARSSVTYIVSADLATDRAYSRFGPQAANLGIRSALGLRLVTDHRIGALNLYSALPQAFELVDRAKAVILAVHCGTAIDASQTRAQVVDTHRNDLRAVIASRDVVGQAQGILMERERITAHEAFEVLRHASQDLNVKLRDVAQHLVDTGEDPRSPAAPAGPPRARSAATPGSKS